MHNIETRLFWMLIASVLIAFSGTAKLVHTVGCLRSGEVIDLNEYGKERVCEYTREHFKGDLMTSFICYVVAGILANSALRQFGLY